MPCYNEAECLRQTAGELLSVFAVAQVPFQLVLVDNGSRDATGEIIDELIKAGQPVTKVVVPANQGYGNGVLEGLRRCETPFVGFLCADGQVAADEALEAYQLARNSAKPAMAKVRRRFRKDSWRRKLISMVYNLGMQLIFGWMGGIDLNGNPKVLPREVYQTMDLQSKDWFLDPEMMIKATYLGVRILEFDVEGHARRGGKSNVRFSTILNFIANVARYRFGGALTEWKKSARREEWIRRASGAASTGAASGART